VYFFNLTYTVAYTGTYFLALTRLEPNLEDRYQWHNKISKNYLDVLKWRQTTTLLLLSSPFSKILAESLLGTLKILHKSTPAAIQHRNSITWWPPGFFLSKKRNCTKIQIFGWKRHAKKNVLKQCSIQREF